MLIAIVSGNSGPGGSVIGCIPCARVAASAVLAPAWLVAAVDDLPV